MNNKYTNFQKNPCTHVLEHAWTKSCPQAQIDRQTDGQRETNIPTHPSKLCLREVYEDTVLVCCGIIKFKFTIIFKRLSTIEPCKIETLYWKVSLIVFVIRRYVWSIPLMISYLCDKIPYIILLTTKWQNLSLAH